ncbi:hypothetical protein RRG08_037187 [Elysia crispata]|uniref:Uncharacterized protein n=1 Tax=Elysia crispata TaxID=231223 RepID=A0AAE1D9W0_9GAST|nr:hypothetical protein RRG08_037187 [Elysia crispata]
MGLLRPYGGHFGPREKSGDFPPIFLSSGGRGGRLSSQLPFVCHGGGTVDVKPRFALVANLFTPANTCQITQANLHEAILNQVTVGAWSLSRSTTRHAGPGLYKDSIQHLVRVM